MARVKQGLKDIKTPDLIAKSRLIISEITKNFTPPPLLAQVIAATEALNEANISAMGKAAIAFTAKQEKREALIELLKKLSYWVEMECKGSALMIVKSGFEVKKGNARLGAPVAPQNATMVLSKEAGELLVRWKPVHGKKSYVVELNGHDVFDESKWIIMETSTKAKARIKGLESQKKYWVRIRTISTRGISSPSNPVPGLVW